MFEIANKTWRGAKSHPLEIYNEAQGDPILIEEIWKPIQIMITCKNEAINYLKNPTIY